MQSYRQPQTVPVSPKGVGVAMQTHQFCLPPSPRDVIGHQLNLPPSIPVSLDGEEGAFAYSQHLLQSNTDIKPECYQAPPNRTIYRRLSGDNDVLGGPVLSAVISNQEQRKLSSTVRVLSAVGKSADKHMLMQSHKGALPAVPYQSRDDVDTGDYVSSSLLSSWRSSSSDRTASRDFKQQQQQRSSSADSVKRIVKRFFSKKLGVKVPSLKGAAHSSEQNVFEKFQDVGACASLKANSTGIGESPWDLPPNYVDMIFTRDPITNENQSDLVEGSSKCGSFKL
jgi:hypothetical protein